jgi:hypothetical protein
VDGSKSLRDAPIVIARTPSLPVGHYAVIADLTVTGSGSRTHTDPADASEIECFVAPNRTGLPVNRDHVRIVADVGTGTQTLSLNDLLTTTASADEIALACKVSTSGDAQVQDVQVTQASILAIQVTSANPTGE